MEKPEDHSLHGESSKTEKYQILVRIVEARQLSGNEIDPFIQVTIDQQIKTTKTYRSVNDAVFDEDFVFDFNLPKVVFLQNIISIAAYTDGGLFRSNRTIGIFKIDAATVQAQTGHGFYRKWAMLLDPDDPMGGPKGYVKCDIAVVMPGGHSQPPPPTTIASGDKEDIEGNLLVPDDAWNSFGERQPAKFIISIYKAEWLPTLNSAIMSTMKHAFIGQAPKALVNPYVQVSFAGRTGKTRVVKHNSHPEWNQEIIFIELFPALVKTIRIHVRDEAGAVLATSLLDLDTISDGGASGYLPTFGPSFINLYGDLRSNMETSNLNFGLGEGVAYRGRLFLAVRVELLEFCPKRGLHKVDVENCPRLSDDNLSPLQEFTLFGAIFNASMIEKRFSNKSLHFEISMGEFGRFDDSASNANSATSLIESKSMSSLGSKEISSAISSSSVNDMASLTSGRSCQALQETESEFRIDKIPNACNRTSGKKTSLKGDFCYIDYGLEKPSFNITAAYQYNFERYWDSEAMKTVTRCLDTTRKELEKYIEYGSSNEACLDLKDEMRKIVNICKNASARLSRSDCEQQCRRTELDRNKKTQRLASLNALAREMEWLAISQSDLDVNEFMKLIGKWKNNLDSVTFEFQDSLPDIIIWLCHHNKRIRYKRFKATDLLILNQKQRPKLHTFFLQPYPNEPSSSVSATSCLVTAYFILSPMSHYISILDGIPGGFLMSHDPPSATAYLKYESDVQFQLRSYLFQGRSLIASDDSGLSDPFVRVIFNENVMQSQVMEQTISPAWDETLESSVVRLPGHPNYYATNPPKIIVQVFDYDKMGKSDYLGQAIVEPIVKLSLDSYIGPKFPPTLQSFHLYRHANEKAGDILATFELIQIYPDMEPCPSLPCPIADKPKVVPLPPYMKPILVPYQLEIFFWGLRDLKPVGMLPIDDPSIEIECGGYIVQSGSLGTRKNANFQCGRKLIQVMLPENSLYRPPLNIRCIDKKTFGRFVLIGSCTISDIDQFIQKDTQGNLEPQQISSNDNSEMANRLCSVAQKRSHSDLNEVDSQVSPVRAGNEQCLEDDARLDWWSKYYTSRRKIAQEQSTARSDQGRTVSIGSELEKSKKLRKGRLKTKTSAVVRFMKKIDNGKKDKQRMIETFEIYPCPLENVPIFNGFRDSFTSFVLVRGKKSESQLSSERSVGIFKGQIAISAPIGQESELEDQIIHVSLAIDPIRVMIRVYIIQASNLYPADRTGKADPYLHLICGNTKISDKENRIHCQLNPVFGRSFEFEAIFPEDYELTIRIFDWDRLSADDLMGETKIDLEQRFYSKHRATCGLPKKYETTGYNIWRDSNKPTQILRKLCCQQGFTGPFYGDGTVIVGTKKFQLPAQDSQIESGYNCDNENLALDVLRKWKDVPGIDYQLVPEHVETRPLYLPEKPGVEQGKLEMWIDMFPLDGPPPPPPVDISPRKPSKFQLRVIIWDTKDVVLDDYNIITGQSSVDQYVKSFLIGPNVDMQQTDVHYRSLNGDGNFNWRYIFNFDYCEAEERIIHKMKQSTFSLNEHEQKCLPIISFQLWDADVVTKDDYLGTLSMDLRTIPIGAKSPKRCTMDILKKVKSSSKWMTETGLGEINLFKSRRTRGWWPFIRLEGDDHVITGKMDIELELLTVAEAEKRQAGIGREPPDPLPLPQRPETSFAWFSSPLKMLKYDIWIGMRWRCFQILIILLFLLFIALFIYQLPQSVAQKLVMG